MIGASYMDSNLNLYYIFYTVANHKNISGAAKELFISQPAISKAISKLENNLDTKLFIRSSRGVSLTPEGEILYEQVRNAFQSIRTGEEQIKKINELGVTNLSIGVSTTLCKYVLLPFLQEFVHDNPHTKVSISCQSSFETITALERGSIDIGLVGIPNHNTNLAYVPIKEIQDTFITTETYLKNFRIREGNQKNTVLSNATFMMLNKENISRKYVDTYLSSHQIEMRNIIEVNSMDLLIDFAKIDLGIACVIREFVEKDLANGTLLEMTFKRGIPKRKIGFAYAPNNVMSEGLKRFISYFDHL